MSENPPKGTKVTPEQQAKADALNKERREGIKEQYTQERKQENREVRKLHKDTKERQLDEFLDAQNKDAALRRQVKERLLRRNKAEDAIGPIIEAKKAMATALRKSAGTTKSREARPKDLLAQAAVVEAEIAILEQQLRDMVLRPNKLTQESAPVKSEEAVTGEAETPYSVDENIPADTQEAVADTAEPTDRSAASPLETLDEQLRTLTEQYGASETTAAERDVIRENLKRLMAEREQMLSVAPVASESGTIEYDQLGEFEGNQTSLDALEQLEGSVERVKKEKPPRDPMGPNEDGKPIAMLNSVLYRQAMGLEKRTKGNAQKMKGLTFPADPRYGGKVEETSPKAAVATPAATRTERLAQKAQEQKKKKKRRWAWFGGAGAGAVTGIGAVLLAWLNPLGKKEETTTVKPPERPAATRSAEEAGIKMPPVSSPREVPPPIAVPPKRVEAVPSPVPMVEEPKVAPRARPKIEKPPATPTYETVVTPTPKPEIPVVTPEIPPAPVEQSRPVAPEAAIEQPSSVQVFDYGVKGKEVPYFVSTDRAAFDAAQTAAESQPEGAIVRFEYVSSDPSTKESETIRGAFLSLGNGKVSPLLQDPETGGLFTAPDPTKMSRARRAGEAATGR